MTTSSGGFGFQIVGGHDCSVPATVDRVVVGGVAESRGLQPNDIIASINGEDVTRLSHLELIRFIKQVSILLKLSNYKLWLCKLVFVYIVYK